MSTSEYKNVIFFLGFGVGGLKRTREAQVRVQGRMGGAVNGVREGGEVERCDRVSVLTVGDTLILDLQVLVGPWAGVWEHV